LAPDGDALRIRFTQLRAQRRNPDAARLIQLQLDRLDVKFEFSPSSFAFFLFFEPGILASSRR
jgi:hypothetical protein